MKLAPALMLASATAFLPLATAAAEDAGAARLKARAEACIKNNAPEVERLEASLNSATNFLLMDLCALEISYWQRYVRNTAMLEQQRRNPPMEFVVGDKNSEAAKQMAAIRQQTRDAYDKAKVDPDTGRLVFPEPLRGVSVADGAYSVAYVTDTLETLQSQMPAPELRAFAARAVLDARKARQAR